MSAGLSFELLMVLILLKVRTGPYKLSINFCHHKLVIKGSHLLASMKMKRGKVLKTVFVFAKTTVSGACNRYGSGLVLWHKYIICFIHY